jgi:hypothetical protein
MLNLYSGVKILQKARISSVQAKSKNQREQALSGCGSWFDGNLAVVEC